MSSENVLSIDMIFSEISAVLSWRDDILRRVLFPGVAPGAAPAFSSSLRSWASRQRAEGGLDPRALDKLTLVCEELARAGQEVSSFSGPLTLDAYDRFTSQVSGYVSFALRFYQDFSGIAGERDPLTGLRTMAGIQKDLQREQDRYDRRGTAFSIAVLEVDGITRLSAEQGEEAFKSLIRHVADAIQKTIRSFDDAYYMAEGKFLIILKDVEFMDACAAMDRLCGNVSAVVVPLPQGGSATPTVSIGVAEAQQNGTPASVVDLAQVACQQARAEGGNRVQEYQEKSALEHFANDISKD